MARERLDRALHQAFDDGLVESRRHKRDSQIADPQIAFDNANRIHAASISGDRAPTGRETTPRSR